MKLIRESIQSLLVLTVLTGLLYPLALTGVAQLLFPRQAKRLPGYGAAFKQRVREMQTASLSFGGWGKVLAQPQNRVADGWLPWQGDCDGRRSAPHTNVQCQELGGG